MPPVDGNSSFLENPAKVVWLLEWHLFSLTMQM